ncbi:hypothetical protein B0H19DRAFT_1276537 [Mycena capillaripes]|nr:hypothetical protein B0H19DRAFT_1276537 [Mycena capillaripes]
MSPVFAVDDTLGVALLGFAMSCVLFGVITNQVFTNFQRYPGDRTAYKLIVVLIWTLEAVDQIFISHFVYFYTITHYTEPLVLLSEPVVWTLILQLTIGAIIDTIMLCDTRLAIQHNKIVTATVMMLSLSELVLAIAYTVTSPSAVPAHLHSFQTPFLSLLPNYKVLSLGAGVITDIFTETALCFFLRKFRTGHARHAIQFHFNTGAVPAAVGLLTLISYDLRPRNFQFMAFYFILCERASSYFIFSLCHLPSVHTEPRKIIRGEGGRLTGASADTSSNPSHRRRRLGTEEGSTYLCGGKSYARR